jgi:signal transduction histidine kinase
LIVLAADSASECINDPRTLRLSLDRIARNAQQAAEILKGAARLAKGDLSLKSSIDVEPLLRSSVDDVRSHAEKVGVELEIHFLDELPGLVGSESEIRRLMAELLVSAIDSGGRGGLLSIDVRRRGDRMRIVMNREGRGEALEAGPSSREPADVRADLGRASAIAAAHGGELRMVHLPGRGVEAVIELPLRGLVGLLSRP